MSPRSASERPEVPEHRPGPSGPAAWSLPDEDRAWLRLGLVSPEISVVIPTIGRDYLREAVDSVLSQTFGGFELIVVCDGADTAQVRASLPSDARVKIVGQPRRGVSVARNAGAALSRADIVAFLDDDDLLAPRCLEMQFAALKEQPDAGMVHGQFRDIDARGEVGTEVWGSPVTYEDMLQGRFGILTSTVAVRKQAFRTVGGYDPSRSTGQDIAFYLNMSAVYPLGFIAEEMGYYRRHGGNRSGDPWCQACDVVPVLWQHRRRARAMGDRARAEMAARGMASVRRHSAEIAARLTKEALGAGDVRRAARVAGISLLLSPPTFVKRAAAPIARATMSR